MTASTTLQLKTLKTRKRLSDDAWHSRILIIVVIGLVLILSFCLRSTVISGVFGTISAEIPVLYLPIKDPTKHGFYETPSAWIEKTTAVVVLTATEFIFGDLESFSKDLSNVRNKFSVKHVDGAPDLDSLITSLSKWETQRSSSGRTIDKDDVIVLLPVEDIPMPIVIQVMSRLEKHQSKRIVLASGLL